MTAAAVLPPLAQPAAKLDAGAGLAVSCRDLRVRFFTPRRAITALQGLSLDVAAGEFLTLLGPSGCGKSTFLRVVADLIQPDGGEIRVFGAAPEAARLRRDIETQALQRGDRPARRVEAHPQVAAAHREAGARLGHRDRLRPGRKDRCRRHRPGLGNAMRSVTRAFPSRWQAYALRRAAWVAFRMSRVMTSSTFGVFAVNWPRSLYIAIWSCQIAGSIVPQPPARAASPKL